MASFFKSNARPFLHTLNNILCKNVILGGKFIKTIITFVPGHIHLNNEDQSGQDGTSQHVVIQRRVPQRRKVVNLEPKESAVVKQLDSVEPTK
jgi:hypothetical protein